MRARAQKNFGTFPGPARAPRGPESKKILGHFWALEGNIDKILLPIVTHRKNITPAAFMRNYLKKSKNMYNRSANDSSFVEKCVNLHNSTN